MSPVGPPQSSGACSSSSEEDSDSESESESSSEESGDEASHEPVDSTGGSIAQQTHLPPQTVEPKEEAKPQDRWNLERFLKRETQSLGGEQPVESEHPALCKVSAPFITNAVTGGVKMLNSKSFPVHHSSVILSVNSVQPEILTVSSENLTQINKYLWWQRMASTECRMFRDMLWCFAVFHG
jgi:hypothetical protein